jgi:ribosomal protein S14
MNKIKKQKILKKIFFLKKIELKRLLYRALYSELRLTGFERFFFNEKLINLIKKNYLSQIRYFCSLSSKVSGVISFFYLYRMNFRENVLSGIYSGLKKASW